MSSVAINNEYVDLPELDKKNALEIGFKGEFRIETKRLNLPILKDYNLVFIKPQENNDLKFVNSGTVTRIGKKEKAPSKIDAFGKYEHRYYHYFNFKINKKLDKNNLLSELEYSLPIVEDYHNPITHFQSQFRGLGDNDFETIVHGWVYATRTVFGKVINSLPRQNKLEFMIQAMDKFSTIDFKGVSLSDGLEFLNEYVERRILSRGRLLVATDDIIKKKLNNLLPENEVGLIDPETKVIQKIAPQAEIFRELLNLEKQLSLNERLKRAIKTNHEIEFRFQKLFNRRGWPVDLEK